MHHFVRTCTLCTIPSKTGWTGSTCVPTGIGWRRKISAGHPWVARLTIQITGVNFTITESSRIAPLACASQVNKFAVSVDGVTFFWLHTLSTVLAGAHVNRWIPDGAGAFVVSGNERQIEL